jgi:3-dehydroquinate dehydratase/shikimate dehydrogenase
MNKGRICVSVCVPTVDELQRKVPYAQGLCDLVEMRLDCLNSAVEQFNTIEFPENCIITLRPREQGGNTDFPTNVRRGFWQTFHHQCGADLEEDVIAVAPKTADPLICSFHDFAATANIEEVYHRLSATSADVIKIAATVDDAVDTIDVWKLLMRANEDGRSVIPIAMGEAGKWTRILGLAHGAYLTYASPDAGSETAPGQITARDMIDVYRVKELDKQTEVYGIIAGDTSYSMSPYIHNAAFRAAGRNSVFVPCQIRDLDAFMRRMVLPATREIDLNFRGFAVTNPHKAAIIRYCDGLDQTACAIGAVNTIQINGGKLFGSNTDAEGFIRPLRKKFGDLKRARVAVVGAGGAARACVHALLNMGANVTILARDRGQARSLATDLSKVNQELTVNSYQLTEARFTDFDIVVNTTPLGTLGEHVNETIATAEQLRGVKLVYDLVYNPPETRLLHKARQAGAETLNGFDMLIAQAAEQFKIWTGGNAPVEMMAAAAKRKLDEG